MLTCTVQLQRGVPANIDGSGTVATLPCITTIFLHSQGSFLVARLDHVRWLLGLELWERTRAALTSCAARHGWLEGEFVLVLGKQLEHALEAEIGVVGTGVPGGCRNQTTRG